MYVQISTSSILGTYTTDAFCFNQSFICQNKNKDTQAGHKGWDNTDKCPSVVLWSPFMTLWYMGCVNNSLPVLHTDWLPGGGRGIMRGRERSVSVVGVPTRCDMRTCMCRDLCVRHSRVTLKDRTWWCNKGRCCALQNLGYVCIIRTSNCTHHPVCPQPGDICADFNWFKVQRPNLNHHANFDKNRT